MFRNKPRSEVVKLKADIQTALEEKRGLTLQTRLILKHIITILTGEERGRHRVANVKRCREVFADALKWQEIHDTNPLPK